MDRSEKYKSIIVRGTIKPLPDAEKQKTRDQLMKQYYPDRTEEFVFCPETSLYPAQSEVEGIESKKAALYPEQS